MDSIVPNLMTQERFKVLDRAAFPFNPVSGDEVQGSNLFRLRQAMEMFGWKDPRFMTLDQAELNGWFIARKAKSVSILVRDREYGTVDNLKVYNASDIVGIPSMEQMSDMSNEELQDIQMRGKAFEAKQDFPDNEILIAPARELKLANQDEQPLALDSTESLDPVNNRYVVMADYWRGGLHNAKGIALANRVNDEIKKHKLEHDIDAIKKLIDANPDARRYGIKVVTEEEYAKDRHYKANVAEPEELLKGAYLRDRDGAYHPRGGGRVVVQDNGESLQVKSRTKDGYQAAMELALCKGWTAIELKGSKRMMPELWLEAKLKGLNVVNYKPTEKDVEAYNNRLEQQTGEMAKDLHHKKMVIESPLEIALLETQTQVVSPLRDQPVVESVTKIMQNEEGLSESVSITYEVRFELGGDQVKTLPNAKEAADHFVNQPDFTQPSVVKMTARGRDLVEDVLAISVPTKGGLFKSQLTDKVDKAFSEALEEAQERAGIRPKVNHKNTVFSGVVLEVIKEKNIVVQKTGRLWNDVAYHSLSNLSFVPQVGKSVAINYDKNGKGMEHQPEKTNALSR